MYSSVRTLCFGALGTMLLVASAGASTEDYVRVRLTHLQSSASDIFRRIDDLEKALAPLVSSRAYFSLRIKHPVPLTLGRLKLTLDSGDEFVLVCTDEENERLSRGLDIPLLNASLKSGFHEARINFTAQDRGGRIVAGHSVRRFSWPNQTRAHIRLEIGAGNRLSEL